MDTVVMSENASEVLHSGSDSFRSFFPPHKVVEAQLDWAATSFPKRLRILRKARHHMAGMARPFALAISPELARTQADTRSAEILPLLAALQFLERNAASILATRRLGRRGLPFWLAGVSSEIHRVPMGHVLVIGPSNYPLLLPGVQVMQALAAGNSVSWKPGRGGRGVADLFAQAMSRAGLPSGLLQITDETIEAGYTALHQNPDKVFFTGSAEVGRALMGQMAETLTPCVMELSGCDAVIVLRSADLVRVVKALTFGMRLNGSATCMAPRRVLLVDAEPERRRAFLAALKSALREVEAISLSSLVREQLRGLLREAALDGAVVHGDVDAEKISPILVTDVRPGMRLAQADVFAPVLAVIDTFGDSGVLDAQRICRFALTASIFGIESEARALANRISVGSVLINDLIVPSADPRLPFGGRRQSGFGVTRGAEGLLEMTAPKVVAVRRGQGTRHYEATTEAHATLFDGLIAAAHAGTWTVRWQGLRQVTAAGRKLIQK